MKIDSNGHHRAILCYSEWGPIFGKDIFIARNANTTIHSSSDLGYYYKHPQYAQGTNEAQSFLAGSYQYQLDEIEFFQKLE